jgi:hypothetical protein
MPFPTGWPPRPATGRRSLRFYVADTATADFEDKAYLFAEQTGAFLHAPTPVIAPGDLTTVAAVGDLEKSGAPMGGTDHPWSQPPVQRMAHCCTLRICNDSAGGGASLEVSFDGTNVHDVLKPGEQVLYRDRFEAGIAVRGLGADYRIAAW